MSANDLLLGDGGTVETFDARRFERRPMRYTFAGLSFEDVPLDWRGTGDGYAVETSHGSPDGLVVEGPSGIVRIVGTLDEARALESGRASGVLPLPGDREENTPEARSRVPAGGGGFGTQPGKPNLWWLLLLAVLAAYVLTSLGD